MLPLRQRAPPAAGFILGSADSLSGWVHRALEERVVKERRLLALRNAVAEFEATFGAITDQEIAVQLRADRDAAVVIRRGAPKRTRTGKKRAAA